MQGVAPLNEVGRYRPARVSNPLTRHRISEPLAVAVGSVGGALSEGGGGQAMGVIGKLGRPRSVPKLDRGVFTRNFARKS
jgi:flagellar biosynthesis/type III secretory pathway ATPase